jgi:undecaprenyl diphosphate synthase
MDNSISHLAIIMDGNRRWAKKNKLSFGTGYAEGGFGAVKRTIEFCLSRGIKHLSLYAFSLENFKRPQEEQDFLFDTIVNQGEKNIPYLKKHDVQVKFVGERSVFPPHVIPTCELVERETQHCSSIFVNLLFCYGGRQEIVSGVKKLLKQMQEGVITENQITEQRLQECLWTANTPDPELIIRTSGVQRLSNFLLFQSAYSEFCFLDCLWPEITEKDLAHAVDSYSDVRRNFGV